jgi:hypothetical protein
LRFATNVTAAATRFNKYMFIQQKEAKTRLSLVGDGQGWRVAAPAQRV